MQRNQLKATLKVAGPLILGNLTQIGFGLIDTAMVGMLGYKQLAASSLVNNITAIPLVFALGIVLSVAQMVAIANGGGDKYKAGRVLAHAIPVALLTGCFMAAGVHVFSLFLDKAGQDAEVVGYARNYLLIMGYSLIPLTLFAAAKNFADGLQSTKTAMFLSLSALPLNALLCWIFIFGKWGCPPMGIDGAGWATLISRIVQAIAMFLVIFRSPIFRPYFMGIKIFSNLKMSVFKEIAASGIPISMQYCMEAGAFSVSGIMIGWIGAVEQAAHQISLNCASTTFMVAIGISSAGSIRISDAFGKKDSASLVIIARQTTMLSIMYGITAAVILIVFNKSLPYLFSPTPLVCGIASQLLVYAAIFQVSDATQSLGVGLCRGVKDIVWPTVFVTIAYWVIGIPLGSLLAFKMGYGVYGIWIGFVVGLTLSSIFLNIRFFRNLAGVMKRM